MSKYLFTSESVSEGHPDKICDQISDTILDACLTQDPDSRVAAETSVKNNQVFIFGEVRSEANINVNDLTRQKIAEIGYTDEKLGFSANTCKIDLLLDRQSPDIAGGVDQAQEQREDESQDPFDLIGAGDQGLMFGFACNETPERMPFPIAAAHRLARGVAKVRKDGGLPYLRPDAKTQVTVAYEDGRPVGIETILISTQHAEEATQAQIRQDLWEQVVIPTFTGLDLQPDLQNTRFLINPTGNFVIGGPVGDSGLTGRKIIVDTYGGYSRHGGGAFSGKDPTKVDRSAAYGCRHIAKNLVAAGLADKCEVQLSYAIGVAKPVSIFVETFGTGKLPQEKILHLVKEHFELRPAGLIATFNLQKLPAERGGRFYQDIAAYGHFGRSDLDLPWERLDKVELLQQAIS